MMRSKMTIALTAAALLVGVLAVAKGASTMMAKPTAVGVVNIADVFDALTEKQAIDAQLKSQVAEITAQQAAKKKQIEDLEFDLNALKVGTSNYNKKQEELQQATIDMQVWARFVQAKAAREGGIQLERIYNKMTDAIARVAQDNGYDLVLYREPDLSQQHWDSPQQLSQLLELRKVLYAGKQIDLTNQVIQRMNNEYENAR